MAARTKPTLLFVVTEDWYFCSHRLPLALSAIQAGYEVAIATRVTHHGDMIKQAGIIVYPWNVSRGSTNLLAEIYTLYALFKIYLKVKPDLIHQVALKPVLYGSFAAKLTGCKKVINALGGMGSVFNNGKKQARWLKASIVAGFKWFLSGQGKILILQNQDDCDLMTQEAGVDASNIRLIRGAGVNMQQFDARAEPDATPLVILPARMLWDKGVAEYVEAARMLRSEGIDARFALVGGIDAANPTGISLDQLNQWVAAGVVEWFGMRVDMPEVLRQANLVCLPSYREGLPKSLLEAASSARAIVTTDVPGCREIVRDGENGLLVPAQDAAALAAALKKLILDSALRQQMGRNGRNMILKEFSEELVVKATLDIYRELMPDAY